jgi:hypothetical protein
MVDDVKPVETKVPGRDPNEESTEEIEAKTELVKAETAAIEIRHGFIDRLIMRGVIPLALLVAAPAATYYFTSRANESEVEVRKVSESIDKLDKLIEGVKLASARSDEAKAAELIALRRIASALQWTTVVSQARDAAGLLGRRALVHFMAQPGATFETARQDVEDVLYAHLAPRVDSDPKLLKDAIRGAVDELRPASSSAPWSGTPAPPPRFPTRGE